MTQESCQAFKVLRGQWISHVRPLEVTVLEMLSAFQPFEYGWEETRYGKLPWPRLLHPDRLRVHEFADADLSQLSSVA
jgi:hypothetical protein